MTCNKESPWRRTRVFLSKAKRLIQRGRHTILPKTTLSDSQSDGPIKVYYTIIHRSMVRAVQVLQWWVFKGWSRSVPWVLFILGDNVLLCRLSSCAVSNFNILASLDTFRACRIILVFTWSTEHQHGQQARIFNVRMWSFCMHIAVYIVHTLGGTAVYTIVIREH